MSDTEIEVEVEPAQVNGAVVVTPDQQETQPDPAVEDLREQLKAVEAREAAEKTRADTEAKRRTDAEAEAARLRESETASRAETVDSQLDAVANAISAARSESDSAKRDLAAAGELGDWTKVAEAQERLADARAKMLTLGQSKNDLEQAKKTPPQREAVRQPTPSADPHETFIQSRTPATQTWLRKHMDVLRDPQLNAIAVGADAEAQRRGIAPDSAEYFALVETRLGYRQEEVVPEVKVDPKPEQKTQRKPVVSAPVSREANGQQGGKQIIRLTQEEAARSTDGTHVWDRYDKEVMEGKVKAGTPIGHHEMARRKQIMQMNGEYDRKGDE